MDNPQTGQIDVLTGETKIPLTGPGAKCHCGCGLTIPAGRKKTCKYFDPSKCHNKYIKNKKLENKARILSHRYGKFLEFKAKYPDIKSYLVSSLRRMKRGHFSKYSIRCFWILYRVNREKKTGRPFPMNDHCLKFYTTEILAECLDLSGFIETRERK